jgi:hypothetical protein
VLLIPDMKSGYVLRQLRDFVDPHFACNTEKAFCVWHWSGRPGQCHSRMKILFIACLVATTPQMFAKGVYPHASLSTSWLERW